MPACRESIAQQMASMNKLEELYRSHPHASSWGQFGGLVADGLVFSWRNVSHKMRGLYAVVTSSPPPPPLESGRPNATSTVLGGGAKGSDTPERSDRPNASRRSSSRREKASSKSEKRAPLLGQEEKGRRPSHSLVERRGDTGRLHPSMAPIRVEVRTEAEAADGADAPPPRKASKASGRERKKRAKEEGRGEKKRRRERGAAGAAVDAGRPTI